MKAIDLLVKLTVLAALVLAGAAPASADAFSGKYAFAEGAGQTAAKPSSVWTVTPCGDGCVHIVTSTGATDTEAHLDGPLWVFEKYVDPGIECAGNSYTLVPYKIPALMQIKINPDTLLGQWQPVGTPCGTVPPVRPFTLTKIPN